MRVRVVLLDRWRDSILWQIFRLAVELRADLLGVSVADARVGDHVTVRKGVFGGSVLGDDGFEEGDAPVDAGGIG